MGYNKILYEKKEHIVIITLNRPEVHNCLSLETASELHQAWQTFRDDDDAFVAIMTGAGKKASSMGDFDRQRANLYNSPGPCGYTRRVDLFKPTIGAINGYCFAAGLETACTLDIRIAVDHAEFGCLERRWNIVLADGGNVRLPMIVGFGRALELIITGRRINAEEALRIGLVTEIVPGDRLMDRALELARAICELPQGAIRADKETVMRSWGRPVSEGLFIEAEMASSMLMRQDRHSEGASAFVEKRRPDWKNFGR
jgi:enoyl-CoA hydratase